MMTSETNLCAVLIPYYKNELTKSEQYSLNVALDIFQRHPVLFISPENLRVSEEYNYIPSVRFSDKYFSSLAGYNHLLLSTDFYGRFLDFKYILIYQLDALVFRDELSYWCSLGFDYYGAPWIHKTWKWKYFNFFGIINREVGNGGFSLRRPEIFFSMAKKITRIKKFIRFGEDIFWCNYGKVLDLDFKILTADKAFRFAFETNPSQLYLLNGNSLPFGCHAFEKNEIEFWKSKVPKAFG